MTGALLSAQLDATQWVAALTRVQRVMGSGTPLMRAIGNGLLATASKRFDTGVDPQGKPWAPLKPAYARTKSNHLILVESGLLRRLSMATTGTSVQIGTNRVYGRIHQFGGTIKAKARQQSVYRKLDKHGDFARGGRFTKRGQSNYETSHMVPAHSWTMPARPYLGFGPRDQQVVEDAIAAVLGGAMDGIVPT